jgi:4'-phosphopantetheinyl transferase
MIRCGAPPAGHPPDPDDVHLWTFDLVERPSDWSLLDSAEQERAGRFHFDRDRGRFVAGRARLRRILGRYLDMEPAALTLHYGGLGKPSVPGPLRFNLSHTGAYAALAVARFDLGVDIECVRPISEGIAERFFAAEEVAALHGLPADRQQDAFFACWTRKEAFVKAVGDGLLLPLDSFSVSLDTDTDARLLRVGDDEREARQWQVHHFMPAPNIMGAIVARRLGWAVVRMPPIDGA